MPSYDALLEQATGRHLAGHIRECGIDNACEREVDLGGPGCRTRQLGVRHAIGVRLAWRDATV